MMYSSRRKSTRATSKKNKTRSKRTYLKFRKMRGGGMTFEQFIKERDRLQKIMGDYNANGLIAYNEEDAFNKLWAEHPEHVKKLSDDLKEETKAKAEASAKAVAKAAAEENAKLVMLQIQERTRLYNEQLANASKFKQSFLDYKPVEPTRVLSVEDVKGRLVYSVGRFSPVYQLNIPSFVIMTEHKYDEFLDFLNNLHIHGLFDSYTTIVKYLYGEGITQLSWDKIQESDKTNIHTNIKILSDALGNPSFQILRTDMGDRLDLYNFSVYV